MCARRARRAHGCRCTLLNNHESTSARAPARTALDRSGRCEPAAELAGARHGAHASARRVPRSGPCRQSEPCEDRGVPLRRAPRGSSGGTRSRRVVGQERAPRGDARRGDPCRRAVRGDLRVGLPRQRSRTAVEKPARRHGPRCRPADLWRQLHGFLQRSRRRLDLRLPEPAPAAARRYRIHRAFRQRIRCARAQRSAPAFRAHHLARPGAHHHRRRLHRLRARAAGGEGDRPVSRDRPRPGRLQRGVEQGRRTRRTGCRAEAGAHRGRSCRRGHPHRRAGRQRSGLRGPVRSPRRGARRDTRRTGLHTAPVRDRSARQRGIARVHS